MPTACLPILADVLLKSVLVVSFLEGINYIFFYRTPGYLRAVSELERSGRELEKAKKQNKSGGEGGSAKRVKQWESQLRMASRDFFFYSTYTTIITTGGFFAALWAMGNLYDGKAVAELPFQPVWMFKKVMQRTLKDAQPTDCSCYFICILVASGLRPNLQKLLGVAPTRVLAANTSKGLESFYHLVQAAKKA